MPAFGEAYDKEEISAVVSYIRTFCADADAYPPGDLNFRRLLKTGKAFPGRPLPFSFKAYLESYVRSITFISMGKLFPDKNVRKRWEALRIKAGVPKATRQQLRKTFATLVASGSYQSEAQALLEHSSRRVTESHYLSKNEVLRAALERLPVNTWLSACGFSNENKGLG